MSKRLTTAEQTQLDELEKVIEGGLPDYLEVSAVLVTFQAEKLRRFREVVDALYLVKRGRLYRSRFTSFEDYMVKRWGLSLERGKQLAKAGELIREMGTLVPVSALPQSERECRALGGVPAEIRAETLNKMAAEAEHGEPRSAVRLGEIAAEVLAALPAERQREVIAGNERQAIARVTPTPRDQHKERLGRVRKLLDRAYREVEGFGGEAEPVLALLSRAREKLDLLA